jgi:sirohydrochlorin cobaltochelatase
MPRYTRHGMTDRALVLVAHGSPDPDWRRPLERLVALLGESLGDAVALAYLAHAPAIDDAVATLHAAGYRRVLVVAALLSPGGRHVKVDIPEGVAAARERWPDVEIELVPGALGDDERVIAALAAASLDQLRG